MYARVRHTHLSRARNTRLYSDKKCTSCFVNAQKPEAITTTAAADAAVAAQAVYTHTNRVLNAAGLGGRRDLTTQGVIIIIVRSLRARVGPLNCPLSRPRECRQPMSQANGRVWTGTTATDSTRKHV